MRSNTFISIILVPCPGCHKSIIPWEGKRKLSFHKCLGPWLTGYILYNFPRNIQQPTRTHQKSYSILGNLRIFYTSIASSLFRGFYTATNLILSQYIVFLISASFRFFKYLIPSTFDTPSSQNPTIPMTSPVFTSVPFW